MTFKPDPIEKHCLLLVFSLFFNFAALAHSDHAAPVKDKEHPALQVVVLEEQLWYEAADKAVAREIASPRNSKARAMSIAEIIIPAGVEVVPHHHVMEEVYYITKGEAVMIVEDETVLVKAGQAVVLAPHQWHNIKNDTDEDLHMIVTCAPAWAPERLEFDRSTIPLDK